MKVLPRKQFGDPILRIATRQLSYEEIKSQRIQQLIRNMHHTLTSLKLGVGLAAPQVGYDVSLIVISVRPTVHRPNVTPYEAVMINPVIKQTYGRRYEAWEGCISSGDGKAGLFAKVPRYKRVQVGYSDEHGVDHDVVLEGLPAHIVQHEVDHINGVLFVDRVKDTKSYMTYKQYLKRIVSGRG